MASAAEQFSVNTSQYQQQALNDYGWLGNGLSDFFAPGLRTGQNERIKAFNINQANALEEARLNSARNYEMFMENTKYQRLVKDLEAAGLNPWLAMQNGLTSASTSSSASSAKSQVNKTDKSSSSGLLGTAMKILALLALK